VSSVKGSVIVLCRHLLTLGSHLYKVYYQNFSTQKERKGEGVSHRRSGVVIPDSPVHNTLGIIGVYMLWHIGAIPVVGIGNINWRSILASTDLC